MSIFEFPKGPYKKTGYPRGRPRFGEVRPISVNAFKCREYRLDRIARDPSYKEKLAKQARDWREKNKDRSNEISRNAARRKKNWNGVKNLIITVIR